MHRARTVLFASAQRRLASWARSPATSPGPGQMAPGAARTPGSSARTRADARYPPPTRDQAPVRKWQLRLEQGSRVCTGASMYSRAALQGRAGAPAPASHNTSGTRGNAPRGASAVAPGPSRRDFSDFIFRRRQPLAELPLRPSFLWSFSGLSRVRLAPAGAGPARPSRSKRKPRFHFAFQVTDSIGGIPAKRKRCFRLSFTQGQNAAPQIRRCAFGSRIAPGDRKRLPGTADLEIGEPRAELQSVRGTQPRSSWRRLKRVRSRNPARHAAWLFLERP